jgi:hypothetical protein
MHEWLGAWPALRGPLNLNSSVSRRQFAMPDGVVGR